MRDWQIGSFTLQGSLLALIISCVIGYGMIYWITRRGSEEERRGIDVLFNAFMIVVLWWKFGHVIFSPEIIWERPMGIVFFSGGAMELLLGAVTALLYVLYRIRKDGLSAGWLLDYSVLAFAVGTLVYQLFGWRYGQSTDLPWGVVEWPSTATYHPLNAYAAFVVIVFLLHLLWVQRRRPVIGEHVAGRRGLLFLGIGFFLVSLFGRHTQTEWFLLSYEQLGYIVMALLGVVVPVRK